jgi:formate/nitrite transporter FocA (FNT family)
MDTPTPTSGDENRNALSPASKMEGFSEKERDAVEKQSRPSAALIHETIRAEGESELERTATALLLSGFAAGLSMGFSLITEGLLLAHLPKEPWRELVANFGYTIGFLVVVLGRQQLFTENTLTPILPLLYHRDGHTLRRVLRLWGLVLAANTVGTFVMTAVVAHGSLFDPPVEAAFAEIGRKAVSASFGTAVLKGVFAGWLIALMAWLMPTAEGSRPLIIILITYVVALGGFTHVVAGSIDAFYLVHTGEIGYGAYLARFFVPTLIGNVLGGVTLVAALNFGQVKPEIEHI